MKHLFLVCATFSISFASLSQQDSIPVSIYTSIFYDTLDEWIELEIEDTNTNVLWYDTAATVYYVGGFRDTAYLDSGTYRCEIIDMGANVNMPEIKINNGQIIVPWNFNEQAYIFTVPYSQTNINHNLSNKSIAKLYPNPTKGLFTVSIAHQVEVFDLMGNLVLRTKEQEIDLRDHPNGIYFVRIGERTEKLVLAK